jgi:hypothetical protein
VKNTRSALNADGLEPDLHGSVKIGGGDLKPLKVIVFYKYLMFHFNFNGNSINSPSLVPNKYLGIFQKRPEKIRNKST